MKNNMDIKILFIFTFMALNIFNVAYASKWPVNLAGDYHCDSIEVDVGNRTQGKMSLKKTGSTYSVKMDFDDGASYFGTGIYNPIRHMFSLVFINVKKSDEIGIALSEIKKDYSHHSVWTYANKTNTSTAICVKLTS